jgi:RimJ/RimL family protein N-acetyltransferase
MMWTLFREARRSLLGNLEGSDVGERAIPRVPPDTELVTSRCLLRYPRMSDAPRALSAFRSSSFPEDLPLGRIGSIEGARRWIRVAQERWREGSAFTWSVECRSDRVLVGQVTLSQVPEPGRLALAFWIHPDCWGQGLATEAAMRAVEFAFDDLGAERVWAGAAEWNTASARVLRRLGMRRTAANPDGYRIEGEPVATEEFEISRGRWRRVAGSPSG